MPVVRARVQRSWYVFSRMSGEMKRWLGETWKACSAFVCRSRAQFTSKGGLTSETIVVAKGPGAHIIDLYSLMV